MRIEDYPQTVKVVTPSCLWCRDRGVVEMDRDAWFSWQSGTHIQVAAPELTPALREQLITGTHPECWDKMVPPEEE